MALAEALEWWHTSEQLLILDRATGSEAAQIEIGRSCSLHTINSFEQDRLLFLDVITLNWPVYPQYQPLPELFRAPPLGRPVQFVVDVDRARVVGKSSVAYNGTLNFPCIDYEAETKAYDHGWMRGISAGKPNQPKFFNQLVAFK